MIRARRAPAATAASLLVFGALVALPASLRAQPAPAGDDDAPPPVPHQPPPAQPLPPPPPPAPSVRWGVTIGLAGLGIDPVGPSFRYVLPTGRVGVQFTNLFALMFAPAAVYANRPVAGQERVAWIGQFPLLAEFTPVPILMAAVGAGPDVIGDVACAGAACHPARIALGVHERLAVVLFAPAREAGPPLANPRPVTGLAIALELHQSIRADEFIVGFDLTAAFDSHSR